MQLNVLIVDDSSTMRSILRKIVLMSGMPVGNFLEASNGKEGLDMLEKQWIDLILLDLNMPVMGGMDMIDSVREKPEWADTPIIVVSTESSQSRIEKIKSHGIHFIHKPFKPEHVRKIVEQYWEISASHATQKLLLEVGQEVFESLAFMMIAAPEEEKPANGPCECVQIKFSGPFSGRLMLGIDSAMVPEVAANMLGVPTGSLSSEQQLDAMGELANVICGNLLARLAGETPVFALFAPVKTGAAALQEINDSQDQHETSARMAFTQGWVDLSLSLDTTIPKAICAEESDNG